MTFFIIIIPKQALKSMVHIQATVYLDSLKWKVSFERTDQEGFSMSSFVFDQEPSDIEIQQFILEHYHLLKFGPQKPYKLDIKRKNPKRVLREIKKEMERLKKTELPSTYAQDYLKEQQEAFKKEKQISKRELKSQRSKQKFEEKQKKKKLKKKGR